FFTASVITEINTLSLPDALPISTTLGRTAAVVRQRRHVGNTGDLDAQGIERTDRGFTTGAGALDLDVERLDAVFHRRAASLLGSHLSRERGRFARALEACAASRCPGQGVALTVGDGDDRVVERSVDVRNAVGNALLDFLAYARSAAGGCFCHRLSFISSGKQQRDAGPCGCARWCGSADHARAGRGGDACRDRFPDRSDA